MTRIAIFAYSLHIIALVAPQKPQLDMYTLCMSIIKL